MKNLIRSSLFIFSISSIFLYSCSKEEENACPSAPMDSLTITFNGFTAGDSMEFRKEFKDPLGRTMRVEKFIHYVSNVYLLKGNSETLIKDVALITYENNGDLAVTDELQQIKVKVPRGSYDGIKLSYGLDPNQNASDPSTYPSEHPLSSDQNTYWSQWLLYRFMILDGRIDLDGDGTLEKIFSHHTGFNESYRERSYMKNIDINGNSVNELSFTIDVNDIYFGSDTVDIQVDPSWHGDTASVDISTRLSTNFIEGLILE